MIFATIFICWLSAGQCMPIAIEHGYVDEAACFAAAWPIARDYARRHPGAEATGVKCAPGEEEPI
jgi:hypothetical protein